MKFVISTQEFNYLLSKCLNVVSLKAAIPILSNLLIEAVNNELILTATDLTVGIRCFTEAKILEEGSTTLPAKKLAQLVRELTAVNLEISSNSNEVTEIIADSSTFKIHGKSKNEFPSLPDLNGAINFSISQLDLKEMLYRTAFAVSREDNRYVLTGVFLQIFQGIACFAGTDGKRLARAHLPVNIDKSYSGSFIIPLKAVEEIFKCLSDEGDAKIYLMNDKIAIDASNTTVITKLLTGDYPDIKRIIPEKVDTTVSLHREELMTLLRQISLFTNDDNHSVRFAFNNGELKLTANTMELGEGRVGMPANYQGPKLEIAFNPTFFLDILRHSKGETVTIGVTDAYTPGLISDKEPNVSFSQETSPLFILMPMRLSEE